MRSLLSATRQALLLLQILELLILLLFLLRKKCGGKHDGQYCSPAPAAECMCV